MATRIALFLHARLLEKLPARLQQLPHSHLSDPILQALNQALREGHTCLSLKELTARMETEAGLSGSSPGEVLGALRQLQSQHQVHFTETHVVLAHCSRAEETIAKELPRIGFRLRAINSHQLKEWLQLEDGKLSDEQRDAVRFIANSPVSILTGAPGTGKTSTVKALISVFEKAGCYVRLAAPTGRAAQRLREVTGCSAHTLHKLLQNDCLKPRSLWNLIFPVAEVLIIDEASMIDLFLMARLISVCSSSTRLILVGDVNQLPPIGPGQVLNDLIESRQIPVVRLQTNYRQNSGSQIITAAEEIREGRIPDLPAPGTVKSDCYFIEAETASEIERLVIKAATRSLPARCGADPYQSIQVLTPKHKGILGTVFLNDQIQETLNTRRFGDGFNVESAPLSFLPGDRVLHTKNNYQLGVFNGQCGSVQATTAETVTVRYGERDVIYTSASLPQLTHGFAISIHRSQGSEYPFVIIPVHESQYPMLNRELLYTALTRGQQMVVLIGSRRALAMAIENSTTGKRQTLLKQLLVGKPSPAHQFPSILRRLRFAENRY
ncbi:MAG: ATP-dependent RecD-like DNA helicase [Blastocatellales bacterium]